MTGRQHDDLGERLAALSTWTADAPDVWRQALATHRQRQQRWWRMAVERPLMRAMIAAAAVVALLLAGLVVTELVQDRTDVLTAMEQPALVAAPVQRRARAAPPPPVLQRWAGFGGDRADGGNTTEDLWFTYTADAGQSPGELGFLRVTTAGGEGQPSADLDRHIIRQATMTLHVDDVRSAFARVQLLVAPAAGEYVESSSIAGEGDQLGAELVLRVDAARLSEVLNRLRELGAVVDEQSGGQDVTGQVVDLEARLRNERRIEQELLDLLESRPDAELDDILRVRDKLGMVRGTIESLQAQRERLAHLVALARVLVVLRPSEAEDEPELEPEHARLLDHFTDAIGSAWTGGLRVLADSLAGVLRVLVGGLIWWVIVALVIGLVVRRQRRVREGLA